jgi:hypothetical protein
MEHQQPGRGDAAAWHSRLGVVSRSVHSTGSAQDEWSVTNRPMPEFKSSRKSRPPEETLVSVDFA